jgi:hypothetical protein
MSDPKGIEDVVETEDGVLLKATRDRSVDSMGVDTVVGDTARREGEGTVGGAEGDGEGVGDTEAVIVTVPDGDGDGSADAVMDIDTDGVSERDDGDE